MEKVLILLLSIVLFCSVGCNFSSQDVQITDIYTQDTDESKVETEKVTHIDSTEHQSTEDKTSVQCNSFSEYLDNENFVAGLSQIYLDAQMEKYSYEGKNVSESVNRVYSDGNYGGGVAAYGGHFAFFNEYRKAEDGKSATCANHFYTKVQLEGLTLPYGITFEDTITTVLQKLDIDMDPESDFVSDEENAGTMTLQSDGVSSLELIKCRLLTKTPKENSYDFELKYTETYHNTREDGRTSVVTRYVILSFTDGNSKLDKLNMTIIEKYNLN